MGALVQVKHRTARGWEARGRVSLRTDLPHLPFAVPIFTPAKRTGPHVFTQFVRRGAGPTPNSYADNNWTPPGKVEGATDHRPYGGFVRDWHLFEASPQMTGDYGLYDAKVEIRRCIADGDNTFFLNILALTPSVTQHWARVVTYTRAVHEINQEEIAAGRPGDARVVLMPDGVAGATSAVRTNPPDNTIVDLDASADRLVTHIYDLTQLYPDAMLRDDEDRIVIAPFGPEKVPSNIVLTKTTGGTFTTLDRPYFWRRFKDQLTDPPSELSRVAHPVALHFCAVERWTDVADRFTTADATLADGWGRWGERDVVATSSTSIQNRDAARYCHDTYGLPWLGAISPMDSRPPNDGGSTYRTWESRGPEQFIASWQATIGEGGYRPADWAQKPTLNDFTENAQLAPTRNQGGIGVDGWPYSVWGDLNWYFLTRYETGKYPVIRAGDEGLYLFHRIHRSDHTWDAASLQTRRSVKGGSTDIVNTVAVLAFLSAAATVEVLCDTGAGPVVIATHEVPVGGMHVLHSELPTSGGVLSARAVRDSATVEGTEVVSEQEVWDNSVPRLWDDYHYRAYSSRRQWLNEEAAA